MVYITEDNFPRCKFCGKNALLNIDGEWWCGKCFNEYKNKLIKQREKIMLQE